MEWKDGIWEQIGSGFTRTDLEKLIGLPYNSLSNALKKDRFYSKKNIIKIERWLLSDKPDPITLKNVESKVRVSKNKPKEVPVEEKTKKNITVFDGNKKSVLIHDELPKTANYEPKENSIAFFNKYGVSTYAEIPKKQD